MGLAKAHLEAHSSDDSLCVEVLNAISSWLKAACVRNVSIPLDANDALIMQIVNTIKHFPESADIQRFGLNALSRVYGDFLSQSELEMSHRTTLLISLGVFDLAVPAIQRFPKGSHLILYSCTLLISISARYFLAIRWRLTTWRHALLSLPAYHTTLFTSTPARLPSPVLVTLCATALLLELDLYIPVVD